jgi:hypothetical protein
VYKVCETKGQEMSKAFFLETSLPQKAHENFEGFSPSL